MKSSSIAAGMLIVMTLTSIAFFVMMAVTAPQ